jgi:hypothetical protein
MSYGVVTNILNTGPHSPGRSCNLQIPPDSCYRLLYHNFFESYPPSFGQTRGTNPNLNVLLRQCNRGQQQPLSQPAYGPPAGSPHMVLPQLGPRIGSMDSKPRPEGVGSCSVAGCNCKLAEGNPRAVPCRAAPPPCLHQLASRRVATTIPAAGSVDSMGATAGAEPFLVFSLVTDSTNGRRHPLWPLPILKAFRSFLFLYKKTVSDFNLYITLRIYIYTNTNLTGGRSKMRPRCYNSVC